MQELRPTAARVAAAALGSMDDRAEPRVVAAGYIVAVVATLGAALAQWLIDPWLGNLPLFSFYASALFVAWYGGLKPGAVAVFLGGALGAWFFTEPRLDWQIGSLVDRLDAIRFVVVGLGVSLICESLHRVRRRAEQREELLRVTLASVGDAVVTTDPGGRVTYLNPVAEALTGWTTTEAAGLALETVFRIVNEETRRPVECPAARALREGVVVGPANHTVLIGKDGSERLIDDSASPIRDRHGRVFGCVLVFRDVADRRDTELALHRREAELRERHDELQSTYDAMPIGMGLMDRELRFVRANDRLAEINGLPAAAHIGRTLREVIPKLAPEIEAACRRVLETGQPVLDVELTGETPARPAVRRTWLASWYPLRGTAGEILGVNAAVVEITDRKRDEVRIYRLMAELKNADRRKDEFLATLAHELRGPLAPLSNMLEVIKRAKGDGALLRRACDTMERQLGHMVRLVDDLLDVGRITRNRLELRMGPVELVSIMQQAAETCRAIAEARGHELIVVPPPEPIRLHADAVRLTQVLSNLLNNACKYTEQQGRIRMRAERTGRDAVIAVSDTGIGIPPDRLESVFEMFSQVEESPTRAQGGLGIGLTLVKRLVAMHGGAVEARSEGPGKGSEFIVRLPIPVEPPAPSVDRAAGEAPGTTRRILVVDDNEDSAASLAMLLKITGNEAYTAYDGPEALRAAERLRPEVILLDIGLPRMDGREVCRRIRERPWGKDVVVIALTGWGQDEDRRRSRDSGFDHHMVKPVDYGSLMAYLSARPRSGVAW